MEFNDIGQVIAIVAILLVAIVVIILIVRAANSGGAPGGRPNRAQIKADLLLLNGQSPDFQMEYHRVSTGFVVNEMVMVAIFRTSKVIRYILHYNERKPLRVDYLFDEVVDIVRERVKGGIHESLTAEVTTIITTQKNLNSISVWDKYNSLYNELRSTLGR
jgi:hypothetical protein